MSEEGTPKGDGGPVYPFEGYIPVPGTLSYERIGLTKRDWFAGQALQGMLSYDGGGMGTPEEYATDSYAYADEMLEARKRV